MTALTFLKQLPWLPIKHYPCERASNSELTRWLNDHSVIINGTKPKPNDEITFPITELIFFPKGRRVTMVGAVQDDVLKALSRKGK